MSKVMVARSNSVYICTPEEADTRIIIHLLDSAENGIGKIIIWTVYSDTPTIVLRQFELITQKHDHLIVKRKVKTKQRFNKGKDYIVYDTNETFKHLHHCLSFMP